MPDPRRRSAGTVLAATLCAVLVAACTGSAPPVDGQFPVTVTHAFGDTVVPAAPRRIVAFGDDMDGLLALDIVPVGIGSAVAGLPAWRTRRLADVRRRTGDRTVPVYTALRDDYEGAPITTVAPDLILTTSGILSETVYESDSAVAPVVGPPPGWGGSTMPPAGADESQPPWQDSTRLIGQAVGRPVEAERVVADLEGRFAAARAAYPRLLGRTAACVHWGSSYSTEAYAYPAGSRTPCGRFLAELGMRGVPALDPGSETRFSRPVTAALVASARPDLIVLDESEPERRDTIIRQRLPPGQPVAVLEGAEQGAMSAGTVLSLPVVLDTVPAKLARALRRVSPPGPLRRRRGRHRCAGSAGSR